MFREYFNIAYGSYQNWCLLFRCLTNKKKCDYVSWKTSAPSKWGKWGHHYMPFNSDQWASYKYTKKSSMTSWPQRYQMFWPNVQKLSLIKAAYVRTSRVFNQYNNIAGPSLSCERWTYVTDDHSQLWFVIADSDTAVICDTCDTVSCCCRVWRDSDQFRTSAPLWILATTSPQPTSSSCLDRQAGWTFRRQHAGSVWIGPLLWALLISTHSAQDGGKVK